MVYNESMIFGKETNVSDKIIELLASDKQSADSLHESIPVSIQAVYKALRSLISSEVIVKNQQTYELSATWLKKVKENLNQSNTFRLEPGDKISYSFNSITSLDRYWKHINQFATDTLPNYPIFTYNPFPVWWFLDDIKESQIEYFKNLNKSNHSYFYLLGNNSGFTKKFIQEHKTESTRISHSEITYFKNKNITVISDYIITTTLPSGYRNIISDFFTSEKFLNKNLQAELQHRGKLKIKLGIENNKLKAKKIRKQIAKDFYVPLELQEKFRLF